MLTTTCTYDDARALLGNGWELLDKSLHGETFTKRCPETGEILMAVIAFPVDPGQIGFAVCAKEIGDAVYKVPA